VRRNPTSPAARLKTLSYLDNVTARQEALAAGVEEALMLSTDGALACAAAANLFWLEGPNLHTPPLECGVLDGTVRILTIDRARAFGMTVRETVAGPDALAGCDGALLTNSLIGPVSVSSLDGVPLAAPAPALSALRAALAPDAIAADCAEAF
jgi:branched-chain amino acid aminotransferase/4-amino-4-deoxychorismate lyase